MTASISEVGIVLSHSGHSTHIKLPTAHNPMHTETGYAFSNSELRFLLVLSGMYYVYETLTGDLVKHGTCNMLNRKGFITCAVSDNVDIIVVEQDSLMRIIYIDDMESMKEKQTIVNINQPSLKISLSNNSVCRTVACQLDIYGAVVGVTEVYITVRPCAFVKKRRL